MRLVLRSTLLAEEVVVWFDLKDDESTSEGITDTFARAIVNNPKAGWVVEVDEVPSSWEDFAYFVKAVNSRRRDYSINDQCLAYLAAYEFLSRKSGDELQLDTGVAVGYVNTLSAEGFASALEEGEYYAAADEDYGTALAALAEMILDEDYDVPNNLREFIDLPQMGAAYLSYHVVLGDQNVVIHSWS